KIEPAWLNPIATIRAFSKWLFADFLYVYPAILALLFLLYRGDCRNGAATLLIVAGGVVVFSTLLPCIEYMRATKAGVPYQAMFIRPLKYMVPLIFVLCIWGLSTLHERISRSVRRKFIASGMGVLLGLLFVAWVHWNYPQVVRFVYPTIPMWRAGILLPLGT